jgi:hypothetical protein
VGCGEGKEVAAARLHGGELTAAREQGRGSCGGGQNNARARVWRRFVAAHVDEEEGKKQFDEWLKQGSDPLFTW